MEKLSFKKRFKKENGLSNALTQGVPITLIIGYLFLMFGGNFSHTELGKISMSIFGAFVAAVASFVYNEIMYHLKGEESNLWESLYASFGMIPGFIILRLYILTDWSRNWIIVIIIAVFLIGLYVRKHPKKA